MDKIKPEDITVEELKAALSDISSHVLLQIILERVKLNEVSLYDIADVARSHPEAVCIKVWQKEDIRAMGNYELTEDQLDQASRLAAYGLKKCSDYEWMCIKSAINKAKK